MNAVLFDLKNPIFEAIYNHYANQQHVKQNKTHFIYQNAYSSTIQPE
jgi:hypothetical protein